MDRIEASELILNKDGSIFHLHLQPEQLARNVILVGDPGRVELIAGFFEKIESRAANREFVSITGQYRGVRITALSTGIGTDNIDIVVNELDALVNIDLVSRKIKEKHTSLNLVRIGTSGSLQPDIPVGAFIASGKSIGFDGLLNFYSGRNQVSDLEFEKSFMSYTNWNDKLAAPYVVDASELLLEKIAGDNILQGVNISAPGFYGPQGRILRLALADPSLNEKIEKFRFNQLKITNYEMESSAIYGLSKLLGHHALTICLIIANRVTKDTHENYYPLMKEMVEMILDKLVALKE